METLTEPVNVYTYATSFWYLTRSFARIFAPLTVYDWFRAGTHKPTPLEIYNIRTDALGLALCALLVFLIPQLPGATLLAGHRGSSPAGVAVWGSVVQHAGTAWFAYLQWADAKTSTGAMLLGWVVSSGLAVAGVAALYVGGKGVVRKGKRSLGARRM